MRIKRRVIIGTLVLAMALSYAQAAATSNETENDEAIDPAFTDPIFLTAVRTILGKVEGEPIYSSDVAGLTELDVSTHYLEKIGFHWPEEIKSMDGIEYFPSLKKLLCYGNDFPTIDLSHSPALEELDVSYNVELKSLDLSACPKLKWLDCNNTYLSRLDVSGNPKLVTLLCYSTDLAALDVSHNPLLETLDIWDTHLTSLDVSHNPDLTYLDCRWNHMCAMDSVRGLEQCPKLTYATGNPEVDTFLFTPQEENFGEGHSWDSGRVTVEPDCVKAGERTYTCVHCAAVRTEELAASGRHTPEANWEADRINHWHPCTGCGIPMETVAHTKTWDKDRIQHWARCEVCGWIDSGKTEHAYDNDQDATCSICGYKRVVIPYVPSASSSSSGSSYTITATAGEGGEIDPSGRVSVWEGGDKVFTIIPGKGYVTADVLVDGKSVGAVAEYGFEKVSKAHTIEVSFRQAVPGCAPCPKDESCPIWPYTDADAGEWYHDGVHYCIEKGLMLGYGHGKFGPGDPLSRGMAVQILYNEAGRPAAFGSSPFEDVPGEKCYVKAVAWASGNGLVNGFGDGSFRPDEPVTREQIAAILYRYTAYKGGDVIARADLGGFTDAARISGYAREPLAWAKARGLINGTDWGGIHPGGYATRAETAAILMRFCENVLK
jgi:hypothetical protein